MVVETVESGGDAEGGTEGAEDRVGAVDSAGDGFAVGEGTLDYGD